MNAYQDEQVKERSLAFAEKSLDDEQKQLQLKAVPAMDVMKAETEVATRQQDLTVSKTSLQLQESLMKAALTKQLDQTLEEMPVVPTVELEAFQPEQDTSRRAIDRRSNQEPARREHLATDAEQCRDFPKIDTQRHAAAR